MHTKTNKISLNNITCTETGTFCGFVKPYHSFNNLFILRHQSPENFSDSESDNLNDSLLYNNFEDIDKENFEDSHLYDNFEDIDKENFEDIDKENFEDSPLYNNFEDINGNKFEDEEEPNEKFSNNDKSFHDIDFVEYRDCTQILNDDYIDINIEDIAEVIVQKCDQSFLGVISSYIYY